MKEGPSDADRYDLSSLKYLGSTGEPWDPDSYMWFFEHVGGGRVPIINISGGTEIVGCFLMPLPISALKPTTLRGPALGMAIDCVDDDARPVREQLGYLVCRRPAPSMTKGFLNDPDRYLDTYFSRFGPDVWFHGDWAYVDDDGFWFLRGPRRRHDQGQRAAHRPGRGRGGAHRAPGGLRSRRHRRAARDQGRGVVCFVVLNPAFEESEDAARGSRAAGRRGASARRCAPTTCASSMPCPRPARARSCAA